MPSDLATTQAFLVGAVQETSPIPDAPALAEEAARFVTGNARLSPAQQVDIYRRQFWLRHVGVIRKDFPGLAHMLGEEGFEAFCRAFLRAHPPATESYRGMVEEIARFAGRHEGFASPAERALAADMARYELGLLDVFVGPDAPPLDPQALADLPEDAWETARILLHPAMVRLTLSYPVHRLRKAWLGGQEAARPEAPAPVHLILYRAKDLDTHFEEVSPEAYALLGALLEGVPLVPACARVAEGLSAAERDALDENVGRWFQQWAAWGLLVGVTR
jgi:hypothetical protein